MLIFNTKENKNLVVCLTSGKYPNIYYLKTKPRSAILSVYKPYKINYFACIIETQ